MFRWCMCVEPEYSVLVDLLHVVHSRLELVFCSSICCLPKQLFEFGMLELSVKVPVEVSHAIAMWTIGKYMLNTLKQSFLVIRKHHKHLLSVTP